MKFVVFLILIVSISSQLCPDCQPGQCQLNNKCTLCANSYQLNDFGWCQKYTPIEGCSIYSAIGDHECVECLDQQLLINGRCHKFRPNCIETSNIDLCEKCDDGFTLVNQRNCYFSDISNCPVGSIPRSGFCDPNFRENCQSYDNFNEICRSCQSGMAINY